MRSLPQKCSTGMTGSETSSKSEKTASPTPPDRTEDVVRSWAADSRLDSEVDSPVGWVSVEEALLVVLVPEEDSAAALVAEVASAWVSDEEDSEAEVDSPVDVVVSKAALVLMLGLVDETFRMTCMPTTTVVSMEEEWLSTLRSLTSRSTFEM
jgi:hypothetical protein